MDDILFLQSAAAAEVAQVLMICLKHSSRKEPYLVDQWLKNLQARKDADSAPIQEAIARCRSYANRENF
ncbi:hypothetical protein [Brucella pituitosa]|uniref:hypothetical protein n=1 Tax=Brucella pituitosa TaxID=571256 RepID=UPI0009A1CF6A|nr:hypothetical protein [Brucella pituitosa]